MNQCIGCTGCTGPNHICDGIILNSSDCFQQVNLPCVTNFGSNSKYYLCYKINTLYGNIILFYSPISGVTPYLKLSSDINNKITVTTGYYSDYANSPSVGSNSPAGYLTNLCYFDTSPGSAIINVHYRDNKDNVSNQQFYTGICYEIVIQETHIISVKVCILGSSFASSDPQYSNSSFNDLSIYKSNKHKKYRY
jgi:hypothetical protein